MNSDINHDQEAITQEQQQDGEANKSEIFKQEVERLKQEDTGNKARTKNPDPFGETTTDDEGHKDGEHDITNEGGGDGANTDEPDAVEASEEREDPADKKVTEKKQRKNQNAETISKIEGLEAKINELELKLSKDKGSAKEDVKISLDIPSLEKYELTQEVKDLLEYTPGLDKMIQKLVAETTRELIEKLETDKVVKSEQTEKSKAVEQKETKYWSDVDTQIKEQYPELTLSELRNSPDFNDWLEYRKSWVDTQLNSVDRFDTSGAVKVFERYIKDNNLGEPSEGGGNSNGKRLAAARSPNVANRSSQKDNRNSGSLFTQEVERLKSQRNLTRTI